MFDPKKFMEIAKEAYQVQQRMQDELRSKTVQGTAGGGMVTVTMNGHFEVCDLKIDPSLLKMDDVRFTQDMIRAGVNDAVRQARDLMAGEMKNLTSQLGLPEL